MNPPEGTSVSFMPIELVICLGGAGVGSVAVARPASRSETKVHACRNIGPSSSYRFIYWIMSCASLLHTRSTAVPYSYEAAFRIVDKADRFPSDRRP